MNLLKRIAQVLQGDSEFPSEPDIKGVKLKNFDWKEQENAERWVNQQLKEGNRVFADNDYADSDCWILCSARSEAQAIAYLTHNDPNHVDPDEGEYPDPKTVSELKSGSDLM